MMGPSAAVANGFLDALLETSFVQLHIGSPGPRGFENVAKNRIRQRVIFDRAIDGEARSNTEITWTAIPAIETYLNVSLWDSLEGGRFLHSGVLSSATVHPDAVFTIEAGAVTCSMPVAS